MSGRLVALVAALATAVSGIAVGDAAGATVLPPRSHPFGQTYKQWSAKWYQWALSIAVHDPPFSTTINHPLVDQTGSKCGVGQSGGVWFLGGAFFAVPPGPPPGVITISRQCTVPMGKALFFPMINAECTGVEGTANGCGATLLESQAIVKGLIDNVSAVEADVDNQPIVPPAEPTDFRVGAAGAGYCVQLPRDDLLSFIGEGPFSPGPSCDTADDGYYVMLAPLPRGSHTVHFRGEVDAFDFKLDVTYRLTVQ